MDKVNAYIYDKNSSKGVSLELPARYEHIEDAYERLGKRENLSAEFDVQFENGCSIELMEVDNVSLYELNHFANKIQTFDAIEIFKLQGAVQKIRESDYELQKLINIAENVLQSESIEAYPAENAYDLGAFYVENDLIPEIEEIHGDARLEKDGANLTEYGALIPKDEVSLVQKLEQPTQLQTMEIPCK